LHKVGQFQRFLHLKKLFGPSKTDSNQDLANQILNYFRPRGLETNLKQVLCYEKKVKGRQEIIIFYLQYHKK
jgi:hypothetical protein